MQTQTKANGSALVFSLVVLSIILTAALGVASVSVIEQRNSSATGKSAQSFQVADSAVETVLKYAVTDPAGTTLSTLAVKFGGTCTGGVISGAISGGKVDIILKKAGNVDMACNENLSVATEVKAVGSAGGTTRAISAAVAAGTLNWISWTLTGWSAYSSTSFIAPQYSKDARTGVVYLRGLITPSSSIAINKQETAIGNLPSEYCPESTSKTRIFTASCYGGAVPTSACRVDVKPVSSSSCNVVLSYNPIAINPAGGYVSLDGISFATN